MAIVMVGTWSLDQTLLWTPGTNATTGEHVDLSDLGLVGAQLDLVKAVKATGKPTVVVLVSGKPVAEPWIQASEYGLSTFMTFVECDTDADAVIQQFYPGELGGLALAEVVFGDVNPSGRASLCIRCVFALLMPFARRKATGIIPAQRWNYTCVLQLHQRQSPS